MRALAGALVIIASVWLAAGATASAQPTDPPLAAARQAPVAHRTTGEIRMPTRHFLEIVAISGVLLSGAGSFGMSALSRARRR